MTTRHFDLRLPEGGSGRRPRSTLQVTAPDSLTVPAHLQRRGLAGYEIETMATFLAALDHVRPRIVYDIGSNIGIFALMAAAWSDTTVVGFEPEPALVETAEQLVDVNGLEGVTFERIALSDSDGTVPFYISAKGDSSNSIVAGFRRATGVVEVPCRTLDSWAGDDPPDVIKMDVESAEPLVLAGGRRVFEEHRPWLVCEILGAQTDSAIGEYFADLGYTWFQITNENPLVPRREIFGDRGGVFTNWLFAPVDPPDDFWVQRASALKLLAACGPIEEGFTRTALAVPGPVIDYDGDPRWSPTWNPVEQSEAFRAEPLPGGRLRVALGPQGGRRYLSHGRTGFDEPPQDGDRWRVDPDSLYELEWSVAERAGDLDVRLIVIQYSRSLRVATSWSGEHGETRMRFTTEPDARVIRLAIRVDRPGGATVGPFALSRLE